MTSLSYGVENLLEVKLKKPDDFLVVKETLTRIGVSSEKNKVLYQSCHILHKRGRYYVVHFKELFALDGRATEFPEEDKLRRNKIASLLAEWGILEVVDPEKHKNQCSMRELKVVSHLEKGVWSLQQKYKIGKKYGND